MPEPGSKRARRARPPSTTTRTSGMVSEVSAIAVARTTLRPSASGTSAARCFSKGSAPCSGCTTTPAGSCGSSRAAVRAISPTPGRNTSTPPSVCRSAVITRSATASSKRGPWPAPADHGRSSHRVSTGNARPSAVRTGASPISAATGAASSVADIASRRRSGRSAARISSASARPRSPCRLRSWNSSKIRQPMPGSSGFDWIIRVRMPSVTTSIRRPGTASPRMRYPTLAPGRSPRLSASRAAAARAATRRGSSMTMRPDTSPSLASQSGTRVVLPAPGGACSTARPAERRAAERAGRIGSIGSAIPAVSRCG